MAESSLPLRTGEHLAKGGCFQELWSLLFCKTIALTKGILPLIHETQTSTYIMSSVYSTFIKKNTSPSKIVGIYQQKNWGEEVHTILLALRLCH